MLKNNFFTILIMLTLITPVLAEPEGISNSETLTPINSPISSTVNSTNSIENTEYSNNINEELPVLDTIPHKQPTSKKKIAKEFILAMAGVGISSILLFLILTIYNKVRENLLQAQKEIPPQNETSLVTPDNLNDAVKTFLEKTNWN